MRPDQEALENAIERLKIELKKCQKENKGWRQLFKNVQSALFGGRFRKTDYDNGDKNE